MVHAYCHVPKEELFMNLLISLQIFSIFVKRRNMLNDICQGIKEVTLLGQNVNSYCDKSEEDHYGGLPNSEAQGGGSAGENTVLSRGFKTIYKLQSGGRRFSHLLDQVSRIDPDMRIRFTSPHPKDFPDEVQKSRKLT